ncbi:hypothetical protein G3N55_00835 [Dissulfurirhabdus thermomarina]|uniref:CoA protein activase n=1 Tax=Dissulfurirhabdus thermomarina TaxID=1765737 RepID=A0A6N9TPM9_DISTH|nr:hypothetical protein [Dissulfurirhabdus thermomarina]NDY41397.1 hypothetical protein [Dissulfurirhabdus thermomarina]NMX23587.1 hypothetical protein [Dissulfurirhabdus thermomarina]
MRITFPNLGSMHIFCKAIAEAAGIPYVLPPPTTERTRELGEFHTNESVCLPLKIILGNFVEALEAGADTIVMVGSGPPCRLGLYDRVIKLTLRDLGYRFRWLTIPGVFNWQAFLQNHDEARHLKHELRPSNYARFPGALLLGWEKMRRCEEMERAAARKRAVAAAPAEVDARLAAGLRELDQARTRRESAAAARRTLEALDRLPETGRRPLRVRMVGEVYTVLEPGINMDIERRLGHLGVEVHRSSYFSTHIRRGSRLDPSVKRERARLLELARPWLKADVGAECNFSVAEAVDAHRSGFDGVVHVYPFSCMPETNAATVLSAVGAELGLPVLGLVLDRQDMGPRLDTLAEAFVDVMRFRREGRMA